MTRTLPALFGAALISVGASAQTPTPEAVPATPAPAVQTAAPPATTATPVAAETATPPVEAAAADVKAAGSVPATGVASQGQGFTYKAEGRRDPFVPQTKTAKDTSATSPVARAAGLAGLGAAEVTLRGVLASQGGYVAMLLGTDEKTYIVRTGDKLADGTIRAITSEMMVIQQQIKDPLSRQKEREVRKMLRQLDGAN